MRNLGFLIGAAIAALALLAFTRYLQAEWRRMRRRLDVATAELQRLQTNFAQFAPSVVVDGIVARGRARDAERKSVTVLFADLVSFTAMSEALAPEVLVALL